MGTNTDPYQRAEGRYRLMPGIIDAFARSGTPFSVLTKGTVLTAGPAEARRGRGRRAGRRWACPSRSSTARCTPRWSPAPRPPPRACDLVRAHHRRGPAVRRDGGAGAAAAHRHRPRRSTPCSPGSPRRAPPGRACSRCTCGPAPASGSWPGWSASTRNWSSRTPGSTDAGRTWRPSTGGRSPRASRRCCGATVSTRGRAAVCAGHRRSRRSPHPEAEQLALPEPPAHQQPRDRRPVRCGAVRCGRGDLRAQGKPR